MNWWLIIVFLLLLATVIAHILSSSSPVAFKFQTDKGVIMQTLELQAGMSVPVTLIPEDANQNPTVLPAGSPVPSWTSSDPAIATVAVSADGMTASVVPTGKVGSTTVTATSGPITGSFTAQLPAGPAVAFAFQFGTPTPVTPAPTT